MIPSLDGDSVISQYQAERIFIEMGTTQFPKLKDMQTSMIKTTEFIKKHYEKTALMSNGDLMQALNAETETSKQLTIVSREI